MTPLQRKLRRIEHFATKHSKPTPLGWPSQFGEGYESAMRDILEILDGTRKVPLPRKKKHEVDS